MSGAWLEDLLPAAMISARTKIWWMLFFLLFGAAYVGGVLLEVREERPAWVEGAVDRAMAIRTAEEFAKSKGWEVAAWHSHAIVETHDDLVAYYGEGKQRNAMAASLLAPAREITVLFRPADGEREFRVRMSLTGKITGFDMGKGSTAGDRNVDLGDVRITSKKEGPSRQDASSGDAEAIARSFLAKNETLSSLLTLAKATSTVSSDDPARTDISWEASPAGQKELTFDISVGIRDSQVVGQRIQAKVDSGFGKTRLPKKHWFPVALNSIYSLFLTSGAFYAIYRYAKRTFQKEVSHARTLIVAALFCVSYTIYIYSLAVDELATRVSAERFKTYVLAGEIGAVLLFAVMGLLVGVGYGSGEGETREAYPGKLTSLDALLAGRIFSRDVAVSVLFGVAAAGWLFLCQHIADLFLSSDVIGARNVGLSYTFAPFPRLTLLLGRQYESLLIAVTGLLMPASLLLRKVKRGKRRFVWLVFFSLCSVLHDAARYPTIGSSLMAMAIFVSALLLPFFAVDLLAAIVSLSALALVDEVVRLTAVFQFWTGFALALAAVLAASVALAAYLALHGRRVQEEDVSPQYAKNLAERMGLQAEVQAAREAQLRLLPLGTPDLPGVQLAACCLPARGVGGDFYDFFRLDANRVGIFVAQGGERGLASALCIALAKGVLMHASQQAHSAAQIVMDLERSMEELLERGSGTGISFAYGVLDTRRNLLNYARVGTSPRIVVHREDGGRTVSAQMERAVTVGGRAQNAPQIFEGAVQLQAGEYVFFFTDGMTSLRTKRFGQADFQWLGILMKELARPGEPLQTSLVSTLKRYQNRAKDDLTAVVLRVQQSQMLAKEEVA